LIFTLNYNFTLTPTTPYPSHCGRLGFILRKWYIGHIAKGESKTCLLQNHKQH
jgi:hypothetical protein